MVRVVEDFSVEVVAEVEPGDNVLVDLAVL